MIFKFEDRNKVEVDAGRMKRGRGRGGGERGITEVTVFDAAFFVILWSVVAERSSLPDSSSGVSNRMWVRIPAVTLVSLSKTLNHNCFSPPRG